MSTLTGSCYSASYKVPAINAFDTAIGPQRTCETSRSRSTSAGSSNSRGTSNTDVYSARVKSDSADLWRRFQLSLVAAELDLADISCEESELTALLEELGFTAIERARLRRAYRSHMQEPVQVAPAPKCEAKDDEVRVANQEESHVNESVFLTGDFFGDDVGLTVGSVVAAGMESPLAQTGVAAPVLDIQPESQPAPSQLDENIFLTGDFFGDDTAVITSMPPITTTAEGLSTRLNTIPPPPFAPPLVHLQPQMPLTPPPAESPSLEQIASSQLSPVLQAIQMLGLIPGSPELPSLGSLEHHMGTCKPCAYFGERGCESGVKCEYCHLCIPGELKRRQKTRRSAQRRMRYMNASEY